MRSVRQPAVAGSFYTDDPLELRSTVTTLLSDATKNLEGAQIPAAAPKAVIVPHAGFVYSGSTAALAWALLGKHRAAIRRIILLGPVHRVPVRGCAIDRASWFGTPLGLVRVDTAALEALACLPQVVAEPAAHTWEHSLEVQLPFVQVALDDIALVPIVVGTTSADEVADVLEALWGGKETVIAVSSDLSHYRPYEEARALDAASIARVLTLDASLRHDQACGATPVNGLLVAARRHNLGVRLLGMCNSGDTAGDRNRVVGYAAAALWSQEDLA